MIAISLQDAQRVMRNTSGVMNATALGMHFYK